MLQYLVSRWYVAAQKVKSRFLKSRIYLLGYSNNSATSLANGMLVYPFINSNHLAEGLIEEKALFVVICSIMKFLKCQLVQ